MRPPDSMNDNPAKPIRFAPLPQELPPCRSRNPPKHATPRLPR